MEYKKVQGDGGHEDFAEGLDRGYLLTASGFMPETAVGELPWWAWALCTALLAIGLLLLIRFG